MHEIYYCQWNKETMVLTTPGEEEERENCADIESAAWYRDQVGEHMMDNKKNIKRQYLHNFLVLPLLLGLLIP